MDNGCEEIIQSIRDMLTGNFDADGRTIMTAMGCYQDHEHGEEIMRACGEMLFDVVPQELKDQVELLMAQGEESGPQVLERAQACLAKGDAEGAVDVLLPLCDRLFKVGAGAASDDGQPCYFDLENIVEQVLLVDTMKPEQPLKPALLPFVRVYSLLAYALHEAGRYEDAVMWLQRALVWNPVQPHLYFEIAEAFKRMDQLDQAEAWIDRAYVLCTGPAELARWYRAKGFCAVERRELELAAAEFLFSTAFEQSPVVGSELEYMKATFDRDLADMDPAAVVEMLKEHNVPMGPNETALQALATSIQIARANDDVPTARECALRLYALTGDETVKTLLESLSEE